MKLVFIDHAVEIERFTSKDDGLFGEVAIVWIIETIYHHSQHA